MGICSLRIHNLIERKIVCIKIIKIILAMHEWHGGTEGRDLAPEDLKEKIINLRVLNKGQVGGEEY